MDLQPADEMRMNGSDPWLYTEVEVIFVSPHSNSDQRTGCPYSLPNWTGSPCLSVDCHAFVKGSLSNSLAFGGDSSS